MNDEIVLDTTLDTVYNKVNQVHRVDEFVNYYTTIVDKKVIGWLYPIDMIIFFSILKVFQKDIDANLCELGVAYGKSSIGLSLLRNEKDKLYLYDFFNSPNISKEKAFDTIKKYGNAENIEFRIDDLYNIDPSHINFDKKLKFLHIDSCHQHTAVLKDLNNFSSHLLDNGIISLDDFNDPNYPGVKTAVCEFMLSDVGKNWSMFAIGHNKVYLCKLEYFDFYRNNLVRWILNNIKDLGITFAETFNKECAIIGAQNGLTLDEIEDYLQDKKRFYG